MNRPSIILTLSLLLFVLLINLNATLASSSISSLRQSPSIRILNVVNSTNSTAEDDATNETSNTNTNTNTTTLDTPTAAPTNAVAPAMAPFTHEPTKKYEPQDDEEEEEEENNKTAKKAEMPLSFSWGV
eukprot:scaffold30713_cov43-Cyclotella_meneghiniana.AAC.2